MRAQISDEMVAEVLSRALGTYIRHCENLEEAHKFYAEQTEDAKEAHKLHSEADYHKMQGLLAKAIARQIYPNQEVIFDAIFEDYELAEAE